MFIFWPCTPLSWLVAEHGAVFHSLGCLHGKMKVKTVTLTNPACSKPDFKSSNVGNYRKVSFHSPSVGNSPKTHPKSSLFGTLPKLSPIYAQCSLGIGGSIIRMQLRLKFLVDAISVKQILGHIKSKIGVPGVQHIRRAPYACSPSTSRICNLKSNYRPKHSGQMVNISLTA